ncbi:MAG: MOSC domain-containing protein [Acidihalobacter sp.]
MLPEAIHHMKPRWPFVPTHPTLAAIYLAPVAGAPMNAADAVEAVAGVGLNGDRYAVNVGFWQATDACQVTLIGTPDLAWAVRRAPAAQRERLMQGHHRRNLVVDGLKAQALLGKRFRIGEALFAYRKPRPPCGYLDQVEGAGLCRALGRHSGVCIEVIDGGRFVVGDALEIVGSS